MAKKRFSITNYLKSNDTRTLLDNEGKLHGLVLNAHDAERLCNYLNKPAPTLTIEPKHVIETNWGTTDFAVKTTNPVSRDTLLTDIKSRLKSSGVRAGVIQNAQNSFGGFPAVLKSFGARNVPMYEKVDCLLFTLEDLRAFNYEALATENGLAHWKSETLGVVVIYRAERVKLSAIIDAVIMSDKSIYSDKLGVYGDPEAQTAPLPQLDLNEVAFRLRNAGIKTDVFEHVKYDKERFTRFIASALKSSFLADCFLFRESNFEDFDYIKSVQNTGKLNCLTSQNYPDLFIVFLCKKTYSRKIVDAIRGEE